MWRQIYSSSCFAGEYKVESFSAPVALAVIPTASSVSRRSHKTRPPGRPESPP